MRSFTCDYTEGAHPLILQRLIDTNLSQEPGYGEDRFCASAKDKIRKAIGCPEADVYFLSGGTQTNATVIDAILRPGEGVIAAATGHIAVHEAGAIETSGHKVLALAQKEGKLSASTLERWLKTFYADAAWEHMVMRWRKISKYSYIVQIFSSIVKYSVIRFSSRPQRSLVSVTA